MWGCSQHKIKLYCLGLHLAGLTLRAGSQEFRQASFIGSKRKKKTKELRSCSIPCPLNAYMYTWQCQIFIVTALCTLHHR